jgi:hypothetical protein
VARQPQCPPRAPQLTGTRPHISIDAERSEFRLLIAAIQTVQRRIVATRFVHEWNRGAIWSLVILLVSAAIFPLRTVALAAAVLLCVTIATSVAIAWASRPSAYAAACRLDDVTGLCDRLSTAWHYRAVDTPSAMVLRQRRDALDRVAQIDFIGSFPVRFPPTARRTAVLAHAVVGLMTYRTIHQAPLLEVAERMTPAALKQAVQRLSRPAAEEAVRERLVRADHTQAADSDLNRVNVYRPTPERARRGGAAGGRAAPRNDPTRRAGAAGGCAPGGAHPWGAPQGRYGWVRAAALPPAGDARRARSGVGR